MGLLPGKIQIQFVSGDHSALLSRYNCANIPVYNLTIIDELTARCTIRRQDYDRFSEISSRAGADIMVIAETGLNQYVKRVARRWVLVAGILGLVVFSLYLPSRVFFVQVKGNSAVSTARIIESAEICGIGFGASRREVRSEKIKNALISALPELQWVGVNTYGCVAEISVKEKTLPKEDSGSTGVSSIVAVTDGIIRDVTVTQGNALCIVGQAVKEGQVLISGYKDCGLLLLGTQAEGEIYAETRRNNTMVTPVQYGIRQSETEKSQIFSLQIGKKLIKFNNGSGISDTICDKMYKKEYIMLPGGFYLPVALITETITKCRIEDCCDTEQGNFDWILDEAKSYLLKQTLAGKLLTAEEQREITGGLCTLTGTYTCLEMIGRIQNEESLLQNGSNG